MSTTYAELRAMLQNHLVTDDTDVDFTGILPRIIEAAERRIYRDLDLPTARKTATLTLAGGSQALGRPADMVFARRLWLLSGTTRAELQQRELSFLSAYWPDSSATGTPKYFATQDDGSILVAPTPAASANIVCFYTYRPAPISAANPSTWLSIQFGDLLDYACLVYAAGWTKNTGAQGVVDDSQSPTAWGALYTSALAAAKNEISLDKGFGPFDHTAAPPMPTTSQLGSGS